MCDHSSGCISTEPFSAKMLSVSCVKGHVINTVEQYVGALKLANRWRFLDVCCPINCSDKDLSVQLSN